MYKSLRSSWTYHSKAHALKAYDEFIKSTLFAIKKISFTYLDGVDSGGYVIKVTFNTRDKMKQYKAEFKGIR